MSRHSFRLKTLQKLREARRDQARGALAEAFRAAETLSQGQAAVRTELAELRQLQRDTANNRIVDVNRLIEAQQYGLVLRAREQELAGQQALLEIEIERRRLTLVEAEREVRVLNLLRDRQRSEHSRLERRSEIKQLDEVAAAVRGQCERRAP